MRLTFARCIGFVALAVAACGPAAPRTGDSPPQADRASGAAPQRTLVIGTRGEPPTLAAKELVGFSGALRDLQMVFNADLDAKDERGEPFPNLAEALPRVNTDTW